ncbi:glycosyl hydrolase [Echria macrotheca]|uniref:Glycosyl hydrolase n=1 Tax=Echria macrotheca TaxID=438768 RepID=A0AAJ0B1C9_9PEZI|nr:glycosyl hydrolase [Echria macrotheca]
MSRPKRRFKSYRLQGDYEKPWLSDPKLKRTRRNTWVMIGFTVLGLAAAAVYCVFEVRSKLDMPLCLILDDDFRTLNTDVWSHEVQLDGFGTGSFDWTTTDPRNVYVDESGLHIVPTLTNETTDITNDMIYNGYTLNLTKAGGDGSCTGTKATSCAIRSNSTTGSMIPPVRSARLSTKGKKAIRYGRVEVVAKLPKGDWLWPAIWMMPEKSVYGEWPRSGEIDIMESRGNDFTYPQGGRDVYSGALHWGPSPKSDSYWRTTGVASFKRKDFSQDFHVFGLEWSEKYLYFYVDTRLTQVLYVSFSADDVFWNRGKFEGKSDNLTLYDNPWKTSNSTTGSAPFDQEFFLILNVAVGSRNGWFLDDVGGKPWLDSATNAPWTFYSNADKWLPTWGAGDERGMTVKSVRMWQQGACGSGSDL